MSSSDEARLTHFVSQNLLDRLFWALAQQPSNITLPPGQGPNRKTNKHTKLSILAHTDGPEGQNSTNREEREQQPSTRATLSLRRLLREFHPTHPHTFTVGLAGRHYGPRQKETNQAHNAQSRSLSAEPETHTASFAQF